MFKILAKCLNIHELRALCELWTKMNSLFYKTFIHEECGSNNCSECKYKRLCTALCSSERYLEKELKKREKLQEGEGDGTDQV